MGIFFTRSLDIIVACVSAGILALSAFFWRQVKISKKDRKSLRSGLVALLGDQIKQIYNESIEQGFCAIYELERIDDLYSAYVDLDGNHTIPELVKKLREMPTMIK